MSRDNKESRIGERHIHVTMNISFQSDFRVTAHFWKPQMSTAGSSVGNKEQASWRHTIPRNMAKSTRQEAREGDINIRREPLRTSNKPDGRRRVARRRDDTPTKEIQMQASDDEQEAQEELPPVTADEGDDDNDASRGLSDDDEDDDDDDGPGMPTKRAKFRDGQPRRANSEKPPVLLPATKVFERDTDGSVRTRITRFRSLS